MSRVLLLAICASLLAPGSFSAAPASHAPSPIGPCAGDASVEQIELRTEDKITISATFYLPKTTEKAPAALLIHDAGSKADDLAELAESLRKRGFAVLVPDLRGHGRSVTEDLDWAKLDDEGKGRLWAFAARDLSACAEYLRGRRDVFTSNLTLIGVLGGSTLAVHHAVKDENARAVVLISPLAEQLGFNLLGDLRELGGLPTLLVAEREAGDLCQRLVEAGHQANSGASFIETKLVKSERCTLANSRKARNEIVDWVRDQVFPRRGK